MSPWERMKRAAKRLKKEIMTLYYALKDEDLPILPRILAIITLSYALSPLDLIPDFIPLLGYLDDLILLPALIALTLKLIPRGIREKARRKAEETEGHLSGRNIPAGIVIVLIWMILLYLLFRGVRAHLA